MGVKQKPPKHHHFVPQAAVLNNFTDTDDKLWFWRRGWPADKIEKAIPRNLFGQGHLYSSIRDDGTKDPALEVWLADVDGQSANFVNQLCEIVRSGKTPRLDDGAWEAWRMLWLLSIKRNPHFLNRHVEQTGIGREVLTKLTELGARPNSLDVPIEMIADRIVQNAKVDVIGQPPSDALSKVLENTGIVVFRIVDPKCSFVIGDAASASARIGGDITSLSGESQFFPVAFDLALGIAAERRDLLLRNVSRAQVRRMNEATAQKSQMIAGRSKELLASLSKFVRSGNLGV